jgi:thiosulfate/3-mercaptopyruvate sulfurtransferase
MTLSPMNDQTTADDPKTLVSTDWLAAHLKDPDLRVLDASWYMPGSGRDAKAEYDAAHIPGARFFDIEEISDQRSDLPHMAPPVEKFMSRMRALGVGDGHQVVVYDGSGLFSAARVWWTFRLMGKMDVAVLDGGFPKWQAEGREVEDLPPVIRDRHMTASRQNQLVKDVTQVAHAAKLHQAEIIDARAAARFRGEVAEPRPGLRSGHIPGSKNLPFGQLLNGDGTMKNPTELAQVFTNAGVDLGKPAITTCGSGVTAAILSLALERVGHRNHALYDGSWSEWGMYEDLAVAKG